MEENKTETTTKEKKAATGDSKKGLLVLVGLLIIVALGVWFGRGLLGTASAAATVNEEVITLAEYDARVEQIERQYELQLQMGGGEQSVEDPEIQTQIRSAAIDELINEKLFLQAARTAGIEISDAEVESELALQIERYPDEASYKADLAEAGITENELKQNIRNQLTIIAYARSVIPEQDYTVTDEELREVYDLNFAGTEAGGAEFDVPTLEEFSNANREQFELQKLGMAVGPLIEGLRSDANIEIYVELPEAGQSQIQETVLEETPQDIPEVLEEGFEQVPVGEEGGVETVMPEDGSTEEGE